MPRGGVHEYLPRKLRAGGNDCSFRISTARLVGLVSRRAWKGRAMVLQFGGFFERTGAASCSNDVGKARADRMAMHCRRMNTGVPASCLTTDCSALSSVVQAFCTAPKGRPALCSEYPALVVSKP